MPLLHHPLLYAALLVGLLASRYLPSPGLPRSEPGVRQPVGHGRGLFESILGDEEEFTLRAALVVFPPLIVGCGLLIGYLVLRSYDIRVFPRCEFPTVPWTAWHLLRCGVFFLVVQRLVVAGLAGLQRWAATREWLSQVPPVIVQVTESNLMMAVTCGLVVALVAAGGQSPAAPLGFQERHPVGRAAVGIVAYVMIFPLFLLAAVVTAVFARTFELPIQQQPVMMEARSLSTSAYLAFGFSAVIIAPLTEEFLFRGFLYGTLRRYVGPLAAICLSAVAFAGAHAFAFGFLPLFVIGFLFAYLYERTGSLAASMAAHAAHNFYVLLALRLLHPPGFA